MKQSSNAAAAKLKVEMGMIETIKKDKEQQKQIEDKLCIDTIATGVSHKLEARSYWAPYTCAVCNKFLWGYVDVFASH